MAASTTYYFRVKAVNAGGDSDWSSGSAAVTTSAAATPTLTAATLGSALSSTYGTASTGVSFTAAGSSLTGSITVTPQSGYEVSTTSSTAGFGTSALTVASGTTVWVRFASSRAAGTYNSATAVVLSGGGASSNANITTSSSGNTMSQKALSITGTTIAAKTYNGNTSAGAVTAGTLSGFVGTETVTVSSATAAAYSSANAGTYSTTVSYSLANGANGGLAANYSLANDTVSGTINKAVLTITANATTVTYGTPASSITGGGGYTPTGFVNSETASVIGGTISYTTNYTQGDAAGTTGRTITPVVTSLTATNYSFTPATGAITISTLGNPSAQTATAKNNPDFTQIDTAWTKNGSFNVMVVRNTTNSFTNPTQGATYSAGATIGSDTVVYAAGSGISFNESSGALAPGTTYYYKFYSENYSYYSSGVTASATTGTAQAQNTSGSATPNQPATIYVGDNGIFGFEGWGQIGANYGNPRVVISQTTDLTAGLNGTYSGAVNTNAKTATSPRFTASGTWYWGIQVDYSSPYNAGFWYKASSASWTNYSNNGTGASLTISVSALNPPSGLTATANGSTAIDLSWTRGDSGGLKDTLIIRRETSAVATAPTQGQAYTAGNSIGTGTVVYRGSATSFTDTGLNQGSTYHYAIYAENWSYYSTGVTANASLSSDYIYNTTSDTTVSSILSGSANLTKSGSFELLLTGANSYTGNTTISAGRLRINADNGLGTAPGSARANSITIGSGTLALDGAITLNSNRGITLTSTSATIDDWGNNDVYDGIITNSGSAALTKAGGGILSLGGTNTYQGATTISGGNLTITNASALGAVGTGNGTTVSAGALRLSGGIAVGNELLSLSGTGFSDAGALRSLSGTNSWAGAITAAANARINTDANTFTIGGAVDAAANTLYVGGAGSTTINGNITGTKTTGDGALFVDSGATVTLGGTNSALTGITLVRAGTLSAAAANLPAGNIQIGNGATTATLSITGATATHSGNISVTDSSTAGVIHIATGATTITLSGTIGQTGTVNTTKIGKSGAGTLRLNSANTYQGQIQIGEGALILANNTAHGLNTTTNARAIDLGLNVGDVSQTNNVALYLVNGVSSNASIYVAPNTSGATRTIGLSGSGSASFLNDHYLDGNATLTGDGGTISFTGAFSNTGGIIVSGGTVRLGAANTFNGTTVVGATLDLTAQNALQSTSAISINTGGNILLSTNSTINNSAGITLNGGTLTANGSSRGEGMGALTVSSNSVIDMGSGGAGLTFDSLASIGATNEVAIHNYTPGTDNIYFTTNTTAASNLSKFKFYSDAGSTLLGAARFSGSGTTLEPTPTLTAVTLSSALSATYPSASAGVAFTAAGTNLSGSITVTAQSGYEVSTSLATGYGSSVSVASGTTVYVRFAASRNAGDYNSATAAVLSGAGAPANANVTTSSSGNTIAAGSQTITFGSLSAVTYGDSTFSLSATASSGLSVSFASSNTSVATVSGTTVTIVAPGTTTITASQAGNSNYAAAANVGQTLTVNTKALTVSSAAVTSKAYDGTTSATITGSLSGVVGGDTVTLSGIGTFASANVGSGIAVTSNSTLGGTHAARYSLTQPTSLTGTITAKALSVTAPTVASKAYDGTTTAGAVTVGTISGFVGTETVTATGAASAYSSANVGSHSTTVTYTLSNGTNGGLATNYSLGTNSTTGSITAKALSVTAPTVASKVYDGTTTAGAVTVGTISGFVGSETVTATGAASAYSSANVGSHSTTVTYTLSNGTNGGLANNYSLGTNSTTGSITAKALSVTAPTVASKVYDGTTTAGAVTVGTISGFVGSETVTATGAASAYSSANVGSHSTTVTYTLSNGTNGGLANNYSLGTNSTTGSITARPITITANNQTKNFGETSTTSGSSSDVSVSSGSLVAGESISSVTLTYNGSPSGDLATAVAGTYTITPSVLAISGGGASASNYGITYANGTLTINAIAPTVTTGTAGNGTTSVTITGSNVTSAGGGTISARGIAYGTSASPTISGSATSNGTGTGSFDATLTGLTGGTLYYARAYATNSAGTSYGTQITFTTEADVPAQVTLSRADTAVADGFTVKWTDVANETGYHLNYSTNATFASSVTAVTNIAANATSYAISGLTPGTTYYVRVRGVSAGGNGTWSTTQVNQLRSIAAGATAYLAPAGTVSANTVAGIFGATNQAGLASSTTAEGSTVVMLLNDSGGTANTIFYHSSSGWLEGATAMASTAMPAGKAFMVKNNTGSTDYFLLNAEPRSAPVTVSVNATAGQVNLLTPARSVPTTLSDLGLRSTGSVDSATRIKEATSAIEADVILIQDSNGRFKPYHHDGTNWKINRTTVSPSSVTVPAGGAFFIRKGPSSNFNSYTPPSD